MTQVEPALAALAPARAAYSGVALAADWHRLCARSLHWAVASDDHWS